EVSASTPVELTFHALDAYGNLVNRPVSFDVSIAAAAPSSAHLDSDGDGNCATGGSTQVGVEATDGVGTAHICNTVVEDAYLMISNVVSSGAGAVRTGGHVTWLSDDFETDTGNYYEY